MRPHLNNVHWYVPSSKNPAWYLSLLSTQDKTSEFYIYLLYDQLDDGLCAGLVGPYLQVVQPLLGAEGRQVVGDVEDLLHGVRLVQAQGARLVIGGGERALALLSHAPASRLAKSPGTRQRSQTHWEKHFTFTSSWHLQSSCWPCRRSCRWGQWESQRKLSAACTKLI